MNESYKSAGVDVEAGYEAVRLMKEHVSKTNIAGVLSGIGGFGGLFELDLSTYQKPVLVSGTDGVGTKLRLAFLMDKHDTIGQDCVAMCVNDIVCSGAKPLFFLDYLAVGKNEPAKVATIVKGVADGCVMAGCALVGGETAEMPGFYPVDEYDLAGFSVGCVDKDKILTPDKVQKGDTLIALPSSGVHSNGFSLVRKIFNLNGENAADKLKEYSHALGKTLGEELLTPTRIYVKEVLSLMETVEVHAISHITGGGFVENIPRMLPNGLRAKINLSAVDVLPVFDLIASYGKIPQNEMFNTFNMGVGLIIATNQPEEALRQLDGAYVVGEVVEGETGIDLI